LNGGMLLQCLRATSDHCPKRLTYESCMHAENSNFQLPTSSMCGRSLNLNPHGFLASCTHVRYVTVMLLGPHSFCSSHEALVNRRIYRSADASSCTLSISAPFCINIATIRAPLFWLLHICTLTAGPCSYAVCTLDTQESIAW
jgi:hypothetical protein